MKKFFLHGRISQQIKCLHFCNLLNFLCLLLFYLLFIPSLSYSAEQSDYIQNPAKKNHSASLSPDARVSLITMDPGKEIYLAFGHTALRIYDFDSNIDTIYNFGVFPGADDPLFIFKFLKGDMQYQAAAGRFVPTAEFDQKQQNRVWHEQELNLTSEQIQTLYDQLQWVTTPDNSYFAYDCVLKNCATQAFDILSFATQGSISITDNGLTTYRSLISSKLTSHPVALFGINLLLGTNSDKRLLAKEQTFMPDQLMTLILTSTIPDSNGNQKPLVRSSRNVVTPKNADTAVSHALFNYNLLLWVCAFLIMSLTCYQILCFKTYRNQKALEQTTAPFDLLLFFLSGFSGLLILYMTFFSSHYAVKLNLNFLWLFPLHLFAGFTVFHHKQSRILAIYWIISMICSAVPFIAGPLWPQTLLPSMTPLMLIIFCRETYQFVWSMPYPWYKIKR